MWATDTDRYQTKIHFYPNASHLVGTYVGAICQPEYNRANVHALTRIYLDEVPKENICKNCLQRTKNMSKETKPLLDKMEEINNEVVEIVQDLHNETEILLTEVSEADLSYTKERIERIKELLGKL